MKGPILSRFDLVFILIDRADDELDYRLSEHVLAQHNRSIRSSNNNSTVTSDQGQKDVHPHQEPLTSTTQKEIPLLDELRLKPGEIIEPVTPSLLQKVKTRSKCHEDHYFHVQYIAYARRYVKPRLTPESIEILKQFYFHLRLTHQRNGTTPITLRQLESLMRLTEVRAWISPLFDIIHRCFRLELNWNYAKNVLRQMLLTLSRSCVRV